MFKFFVLVRYIYTFIGYKKVLVNFSWGSWRVMEKSWIIFVSKRVGTLYLSQLPGVVVFWIYIHM